MRRPLVLAAALLAACRPGGVLYYEETDVVLTIQEDGRDFSQYSTYAVWPSIVDIGENLDGSIDINHGVVDPVLFEAMRSNMDGYGWTEVDRETGDPDVVLVGGVVASESWYYYGYYYWYGYYWWYYPWYPPGYVVSYAQGSVILLLLNPDEVTEAPPPAEPGQLLVPAMWGAATYGELSDSTSANLERAADGIDQAFEQSPYLEL